MLEVKNLVKKYKISKKSKTKEVVALNDVSITFPEKGLIFLLGKSGSGKSTLLNTIGGLDTFDSGEIIIKGKSSKDFSQSDFDSYRNTFIGFIFQEYNVLEEFSVAKNLSLAIELQGKNPSKELVNELLTMVEMQDFAKRKPNQLSGGQKQRVAIARALIKNPEIIMADEPTGALDSNTGKQVMETLKNLSKEKLVIIVSHDREFAEIYGDRIIELKDGKIIKDVTKKEVEAHKTESGISIIDGEMIHIKKGQKFTQEDLNNICKQIMQSSQENDTIISLSGKANEEIKKANAITDEGNKEVFKETSPEDVQAQSYNGNFKLIKSKLKFKDSFKMGASALKSKVGKLVFTILLSFVAFGMFGIVDTMSTFNRASAVAETIKMQNDKTVSLLKEIKANYGYNCVAFTEDDIKLLNDKFPDITLKKVTGANIRFGNNFYPDYSSKALQFSELSNNGSSVINVSMYSGITHVTTEELQRLRLTLVAGRLPSDSDNNEVCITKKMFDTLSKQNSTKNLTYNAMLTTYNTFYTNNDTFQIVGIIDDGKDWSKYDNITTEQLNSNSGYLLSQQISREMSFGFSNMLFVSKEKYEKLLTQPINIDTTAYKDDTRLGYSVSLNEMYAWNTEDLLAMYNNDKDYFLRQFNHIKGENYFDNNNNLISLGENGVILPEYYFRYIAEGEELYQMIDEGLQIKIVSNHDDSTLCTLNVLGTTNGQSWRSYMDETSLQSLIKNNLHGFDYSIAVLSDNERVNHDFIEFCETMGDNNIKYTIQLGSTPILDNFGDLITSMSEVFLYVGIGFAVFAALLLMNFISTSISYKKREIGILRALGARGSDVFGIFFNESLIIAAINFFLATLATFIVSAILNNIIITDLGLNLVLLSAGIRQILLILGVSVLAAFISSFIPVMKIARKKPIDAINNR